MTSVDGSKNTSTLSPADKAQLCNDVYNYVKSSLSPTDMASLGCGFAGINSTDPSTCQSQYSTCVTQETPTMTTAMNAPADCTGFEQSLATCNTTVAEYTKCMTQEIDAVKSMESQFPLCSQSAAQAAEINALGKLSSDCIQLMNTCQMLSFGGSSSSGGVPDAGAGG